MTNNHKPTCCSVCYNAWLARQSPEVQAAENKLRVIPRPLARRSDPDTSQESGEEVRNAPRTATLMGQILGHLRTTGSRPSFLIAEELGIRHDSIWKRCSDLKAKGWIRDSGERVWSPDGKRVIVWEVVA